MVTMHAFDGGRSDGPAALLIHGFMSSALQWERNLPALERHLRTVTVELPGHGSCPPPSSPRDTEPAAVLAELDRLRNERGIERWWVVGHSFGAAIALRYALAHPEHTRGVVFTNSRAAFGIDRSGGADAPNASTGRDLRSLPYHPIHAKRFPLMLQSKMVAAADRIAPATIDHVGASVGSWRCGDELTQLSMPTLLVNGVWEKAFQPNADQAVEQIAGLRRVDLEGGHSINVEQAAAFDDAVLDFIFGAPTEEA